MSSEATGWAWKQKGLTPCARLVLLSLCEFANRDFECWPSQSRIAADIEIPRETVNRLIKQLIEKGLVEAKPQNENGVKLVSRYFIRCDLTSHGGSDLRSHREPISDVTSDHNNNLPLEVLEKKEDEAYASSQKEPATDLFATSSETKNGTKGSRLPADWQPSAEDCAFAAECGLDPIGIADRFRDYWHEQPGAKGVRIKWHGTWRNWCRSEADKLAKPSSGFQRPSTNGSSPPSFLAAIRRAFPDVA